MDRTIVLGETSAIFFWFPVFIALMISGFIKSIEYSYELIFLILGFISLIGTWNILNGEKRNSRYWFMVMPLMLALILLTICAFLTFVIRYNLNFSVSMIETVGIFSLCCLAPCAYFLFKVLTEKSVFVKVTGPISAVISIFSLALILGWVFLPRTVLPGYFFHPWFDQIFILYGLGNVILGIPILVIAFNPPDVRLSDGTNM